MTLREEIVSAFQLHQAGDLTQAASRYEAILNRDPEQVDVLRLLGVLRRQQGQFAQAVELCKKAVALRPGVASSHVTLAEAYRALGELEQAVVHCRGALALKRDCREAHNVLGQVLLELGRIDEALTHCRLAVALQPDLAEAHNRLGEAFRALGRFNEAIACYAEAVRLNPRMAQAYAYLGFALRQDGRLQESLPWFRRATAVEPNTLPFWGYRADAATDLDQYAEAAECYERMIELEPSRALFHSNLGWLRLREGLYDEARQRYETALRLRPDFPEALVGMGGLMEELGRMSEAETWFRRAVETNPADTKAIARLVRPLRFQVSDEDLHRLERRIADPRLTETARTPMLFALSNVLDARGRYADAARCMRRANSAALAERGLRSRQYKPADHEWLITTMIESFKPEFFARFAGAGLETRRPVFIFGLPRSGSSLIEQILASHSQVHGAGELNQGRLDFETIPGLLNRADSPPACVRDLTDRVVRELASGHEARLLELGGGAARVVDKMTDNYLYLGLLAILFPNATFIHGRRNLRDVALSCWITNFRAIRWTNDIQHLAHRFQQYLRLMDHWRAVLPAPIYEVAYEETVDNLENVARRLVADCQLDWEPACLEFHQTVRPVATASFAQVRQPIYKKSVARWKNYEDELDDLFSALPVVNSVGTRSGPRRVCD